MNKKDSTIEVEAVPSKAVATREQHSVQLHQEPLTPVQMRQRLDLVRNVMAEAMEEGQDYGKIPGCGDMPGLFQPGAQKLSMMFQLNPEVREEIVTDYPNYHRGYRLVVRVTNGDKFADGVGERSTLENKFRYRNVGKKCPECGKETIIKGKQEYGGGWLCFQKKGGCGWRCANGTPAAKALEEQQAGRVEHDNPADYWNTVRKMAFKCAFVHAIINATNTSELWSQDLEDLAANGVMGTPEEQDRAEMARRAAKRAAMAESDEIPMEGETPLAQNKSGANQTLGGKNEPLKESIERKTLLQLLRKRLGKKEVEDEALRYFRSVKAEKGKFKGFLLLAEHQTFEHMELSVLEGVVKSFDKWYPKCEEWCREHPAK